MAGARRRTEGYVDGSGDRLFAASETDVRSTAVPRCPCMSPYPFCRFKATRGARLASFPGGKSALGLSTDSVEKAGDNREKNRRQSKSGIGRTHVLLSLLASNIRSVTGLDGVGARLEPAMFSRTGRR
ncbi:protein of unknown function (plasmid) [Caballeronia sp. S22]